jgi:hypothetical protein
MNSRRLHPLIFVALALLNARAEDAPEGGYIFELDGKPFKPTVYSLNGTPEIPRPGDVIGVSSYYVTRGPEKDLRFKSTPYVDGRLQLEDKGGATRTVAIRLANRTASKGIYSCPSTEAPS